MKRFFHINTRSRRDEHSDQLRKEERRKGEIIAYTNAEYDGGHGQTSPQRPRSQGPQGVPPKTKPGARRKPVPARVGSYPSQPETMRTNELDQGPSMNQLTYHKPSPSKPAESWLQGEDDMVRNKNGPPVKIVPHEPDPDPPVLPPRVTGVGEISEPWQDPGSQGIEIRRPGEDSNDSSAVMGRICHHLRRARIEFPSAKFEIDIPHPCSLVDIEMALCDLIRAYGSIFQSAHESDKALKTQKAEYESLQSTFDDKWDEWVRKAKEFENEVSTLQKENEKEKYKISVLREEHAAREQRHDNKITKIQQEHHAMADDYKLQIQRLESEMRLLKERHEGEVNKLEQQHRDQVAIHDIAAEEEITRMKRDYDMRLGKIGNQHEEEMRQMTSRFDAEKTQINRDFLNDKARMSSTMKSQKETYETRLANLRKQNEDDKRQMTSDHQTLIFEMEKRFHEEKAALEGIMQTTIDNFHIQLGKMQDERNQEMDRRATEIEEIKMEHEAEKKKMKELHDAEKAALEIKRKKENKSLRDDVEALTGALVKRDHFKAMSDHELALRFQDLATEVDEFARVRWDNRRESTWPFPDKVLHNSENERRTKQYVVQNTIWVILYEKIFCTPFRVLGNEGKSLEREWIEKYDQDRKSIGPLAPCPKPTKDSEKWRYETMKKCLEAISQPLLEWESNYNLKQGYELSLKEVIEDVSQELEKVASVSSSDKQRMSDLVRKAAKLWLEVGQQRYRIFLLMSDSGAKPSRSGHASLDSDGSQDLVAMPELRRMGNAQGERLERDELVSDCKGRFSVFYAS